MVATLDADLDGNVRALPYTLQGRHLVLESIHIHQADYAIPGQIRLTKQ